MRRFAFGLVLLMFLTGTLFVAGCAPKDKAGGASDAFPKTQPAEKDEGGE